MEAAEGHILGRRRGCASGGVSSGVVVTPDDPTAHRPAWLGDRAGVRRRELRKHLLLQSFDVLEADAPIDAMPGTTAL